MKWPRVISCRRGGTRFTSGTTPTSYQFTGQRNDAATGPAFGLYFYNYDSNGNMTLRVEVSGTQRITYTQAFDIESRLTAVTNTVTGAVTRFAHDGDGNRVLQLLPGGGRTVYVGAVEVSITGTQRITKTYYSLGGQMAALRVVSSTGNAVYYLHGDHLGSVSLVTCGHTGGCNGTPYQGAVSRQRYSPYGTVRWSQGAPPTDIGFTGQRADATGLMFYQARYYSAVLGRFIQADSIVPGAASGSGGGAATLGYDSNTRLTPLTVNLGEFAAQVNEETREVLQFGAFFQWDSKTRQEHNVPMGPANPQALNRYAYCLNNPLRYVDPTGHSNVTIELTAEEAQQLIEFLDNAGDWDFWLGLLVLCQPCFDG